MKPRSYRLGRRQEAVDRTKSRVLAAARKFLTSSEAAHGFSIDAIARRAGVTRATVYHGFNSKTGLLGELYDSLATDAALGERIGLAFRAVGLTAALRRIVSAYCRLWATNRSLIRRLHALADVDAGFSRVDRSEWRRAALTALLAQHSGERAPNTARRHRELIDTLHMLTSFESYDALARRGRSDATVARLIAELALRVVNG